MGRIKINPPSHPSRRKSKKKAVSSLFSSKSSSKSSHSASSSTSSKGVLSNEDELHSIRQRLGIDFSAPSLDHVYDHLESEAKRTADEMADEYEGKSSSSLISSDLVSDLNKTAKEREQQALQDDPAHKKSSSWTSGDESSKKHSPGTFAKSTPSSSPSKRSLFTSDTSSHSSSTPSSTWVVAGHSASKKSSSKRRSSWASDVDSAPVSTHTNESSKTKSSKHRSSGSSHSSRSSHPTTHRPSRAKVSASDDHDSFSSVFEQRLDEFDKWHDDHGGHLNHKKHQLSLISSFDNVSSNDSSVSSFEDLLIGNEPSSHSHQSGSLVPSASLGSLLELSPESFTTTYDSPSHLEHAISYSPSSVLSSTPDLHMSLPSFDSTPSYHTSLSESSLSYDSIISSSAQSHSSLMYGSSDELSSTHVFSSSKDNSLSESSSPVSAPQAHFDGKTITFTPSSSSSPELLEDHQPLSLSVRTDSFSQFESSLSSIESTFFSTMEHILSDIQDKSHRTQTLLVQANRRYSHELKSLVPELKPTISHMRSAENNFSILEQFCDDQLRDFSSHLDLLSQRINSASSSFSSSISSLQKSTDDDILTHGGSAEIHRIERSAQLILSRFTSFFENTVDDLASMSSWLLNASRSLLDKRSSTAHGTVFDPDQELDVTSSKIAALRKSMVNKPSFSTSSPSFSSKAKTFPESSHSLSELIEQARDYCSSGEPLRAVEAYNRAKSLFANSSSKSKETYDLLTSLYEEISLALLEHQAKTILQSTK